MIPDRLRRTAEQSPGSIALVDGAEEISYLELSRRMTTFADFMTRNLAVAPGDVVAFFLPNCWQFVAGFFAVAEIGAVCMPFNVRWRAAELEWYVKRFNISTVVTSEELRGPWDQLSGLIPPERVLIVNEPSVAQTLTSDSSGRTDRRRCPALGEDVVLHLTTSGSTGRPRVAHRTQQAMLAGATNVGQALGVQAGQRFLAVVPFYHANGLSNCMFLPLMHGSTVVLLERFEPRKFANLVHSHRIQCLIVSPFILRLVADQDCEADLLSSVEVCLSSGAPTPRALAELWRDRFDIRVRQLYGSSETGTISIESADTPILTGAVGKLVPSVEVKVLSGEGAESSLNEIGEIVVRSPAMMTSNLGDPALDVKTFMDGYFHTGDLGKLDSDRNLTIVGRKKRMINLGGTKVDPVEVEAAIEQMSGVRQCKVFGVMDRRESEVIKAVIVVRDEHNRSRREVIQHCRQSLAEYKIPRAIEFVEAIPVDVTGKQLVTWGPISDELSDSKN